jgi:hypothetical protein
MKSPNMIRMEHGEESKVNAHDIETIDPRLNEEYDSNDVFKSIKEAKGFKKCYVCCGKIP